LAPFRGHQSADYDWDFVENPILGPLKVVKERAGYWGLHPTGINAWAREKSLATRKNAV
jgi:hypothetical protein